MGTPGELPVNACCAAISSGQHRIGLFNNCQWIDRLRANPGMRRGGVLPPSPVLAPGSALGSRPRVALPSAQAVPVYCGPRPAGNSRQGRPVVKRGGTIPGEPRAQPRIGSQALDLEGMVQEAQGSMPAMRMLSRNIIFI
jgi:hypothetical protein